MKPARIVRELITVAVLCAAGMGFVAFGTPHPDLWQVGNILGVGVYVVILLSKEIANQLDP